MQTWRLLVRSAQCNVEQNFERDCWISQRTDLPPPSDLGGPEGLEIPSPRPLQETLTGPAAPRHPGYLRTTKKFRETGGEENQ